MKGTSTMQHPSMPTIQAPALPPQWVRTCDQEVPCSVCAIEAMNANKISTYLAQFDNFAILQMVRMPGGTRCTVHQYHA